MRIKNTQVLRANIHMNTQLLRILFFRGTQFLRVITCANMPQELRVVKNMSYFLCFCTNFVHILN